MYGIFTPSNPIKSSSIQYQIIKLPIISQRIHGAGIFTYIGIMLNYILGVNVGKYSSTMDPLG